MSEGVNCGIDSAVEGGDSVAEELDKFSTVDDAIRWAARQLEQSGVFFGHGTDNALDEAACLVSHALHLSYDDLEGALQRRLDETARQTVHEMVSRRIRERIPAAYITRTAWFCGLEFHVDERVLVPRSPIAELIAGGFSPWIRPGQAVHRILDMGTGSGCIAIACAHAFPQAEVDAADISPDALAVARINVERHGLGRRVHPLESDLFAGLPRRSYDIIVSNPPYVPQEEMAVLPDEYRHEPVTGLVAEEEGLEFAIEIMARAADYLSEDGILIVEVGNSQAALERRFPNVPFMWLEFAHGGSGVFLLTHGQLLELGANKP